MFDGSSIAGWKAINESDMTLMPDLYRAYVDPFFAQPTLAVFCDVLEPSTGEPYSRDPRGTAKAALAHMQSLGIGDTAYFGPEAEFFIFEDVKIDVSMNRAMYAVDSVEGPYNSARKYEEGNLGHRPGVKGGYFPVPPVDSGQDIRSEMLSVMSNMGVPVEKHHHEVAPTQHEHGMKFGTLIDTADNLQLYKYAVHQVANAYGVSARLCQSLSLEITDLECMCINQFGQKAAFSLATSMQICQKMHYSISVVLSNMPNHLMLSPTHQRIV